MTAYLGWLAIPHSIALLAASTNSVADMVNRPGVTQTPSTVTPASTRKARFTTAKLSAAGCAAESCIERAASSTSRQTILRRAQKARNQLGYIYRFSTTRRETIDQAVFYIKQGCLQLSENFEIPLFMSIDTDLSVSGAYRPYGPSLTTGGNFPAGFYNLRPQSTKSWWDRLSPYELKFELSRHSAADWSIVDPRLMSDQYRLSRPRAKSLFKSLPVLDAENLNSIQPLNQGSILCWLMSNQDRLSLKCKAYSGQTISASKINKSIVPRTDRLSQLSNK